MMKWLDIGAIMAAWIASCAATGWLISAVAFLTSAELRDSAEQGHPSSVSDADISPFGRYTIPGTIESLHRSHNGTPLRLDSASARSNYSDGCTLAYRRVLERVRTGPCTDPFGTGERNALFTGHHPSDYQRALTRINLSTR